MITELKRKQNGWTIEKMTFPKGYKPKTSTWRNKDGQYQVQVNKQVPEDSDPLGLPVYAMLEEAEVKTTAKGTFVVGWYPLGKNNYDYDRADAEKS